MSHKTFKGGDLVRDNLNTGPGNYGLGVVVKRIPPDSPHEVSPRTYEVYFTKFGTIKTFHGDYLERI
jgi:hypothetical protein